MKKYFIHYVCVSLETSLSFRRIIFCLISWPLGGSCQLEMEVVWSVSDSERILSSPSLSRLAFFHHRFCKYFFFTFDVTNVTENFSKWRSEVWQIVSYLVCSPTITGQQSASQWLIFYTRQISYNFQNIYFIFTMLWAKDLLFDKLSSTTAYKYFIWSFP